MATPPSRSQTVLPANNLIPDKIERIDFASCFMRTFSRRFVVRPVTKYLDAGTVSTNDAPRRQIF